MLFVKELLIAVLRFDGLNLSKLNKIRIIAT